MAAEAFEFAGILRHAAEISPWDVGCRFAREARMNGDRILLMANGPGLRLVGEAVRAAGKYGPVNAVVSTGLCGGLDPSMQVGDIFVASRVNGFPVSKPETRLPHFTGELITQDRVAVSKAEKCRLRLAGASAVDMEASVVAAWAREQGFDFFCVRAVSDDANCDFAIDLNAVRDTDGRFSPWKIMASALRDPVRLVPELRRLKRDSSRAASALGDFVADCRFQ